MDGVSTGGACMAALTASSTKTPEGNMTNPLSDSRLFRYRLTQSSTSDTFDTGLGSRVGIVDYATKWVSGVPAAAVSVSAGVFTLTAAAGGGVYDLLVWVK